MRVLILSLLIALGFSKTIDVDWKIKSRYKPMQSFEAAAGDTLIFRWKSLHNVFIMPNCDGTGEHKWDKFTCPPADGVWGVDLGQDSPVAYTIPEDTKDGDYLCFVCEIPGHCSAGQHSTVRINNGVSNSLKVDWVIKPVNKPMQSFEAKPGTELVFAWKGVHNVFILPNCEGEGQHKWNDFTCPEMNGDWGIDLGSTSPVSYTIPEDAAEGSYICFVCEIPGHCSAGQHSTVMVTSDDKEDGKEGEKDKPFGTKKNLEAFCLATNEDDCKKLCSGKFKKGECGVKAKKLNKMKCKKVKDIDFCVRLGCKTKKGKCRGKPKLD